MDKNIWIIILIGCLLVFIIFKIVGYGVNGLLSLILKALLLPIKYMLKGIKYLVIKIKELSNYLFKNVLPKILDKLKYIFYCIIKIIYKCLYQIYKLFTFPFKKLKKCK